MHITKYWSSHWSKRANLILSSSYNMWAGDPGAALSSTLRKSKSEFLGKTFFKYEMVTFLDGSWCRDEMGNCAGRIEVAVINKDMKVVYVSSGPCDTNNAFQSELFAVNHVEKACEMFNKDFLVCVDSKDVEDLSIKLKGEVWEQVK